MSTKISLISQTPVFSEIKGGVCVSSTKIQLYSFGRYLYGVLHDVKTEEKFEGEGYGSKVVERAINWSICHELRDLGLWCKPDLITFYDRFGFELTEVIDEGYHFMEMKFQ